MKAAARWQSTIRTHRGGMVADAFRDVYVVRTDVETAKSPSNDEHAPVILGQPEIPEAYVCARSHLPSHVGVRRPGGAGACRSR